MQPSHYRASIASAIPHLLLFASVSGAHLYGFASPDSDVDLRGCHVLPARALLGLHPPKPTASRTWIVSGVEIDLVSHDLVKYVILLLQPHGNYLEQLFSPLVVLDTLWAEELRGLALQGSISRRAYQPYAGYAKGQWVEWRKQAELGQMARAFNRMADQVESTIVTLRQFVADAAHQMHAPLTALRTNLELAAGPGDAAPQNIYLERAQGQVARLTILTDELLQLSRVETGIAGAQPQRFDLAALARGLAEAQAARAEQAGLEFYLLAPEAPVWMVGQPEQISALADNLVDNALKFTPVGGAVTVRLAVVEAAAVFSVEDTGIGIPPDELPRLVPPLSSGAQRGGHPRQRAGPGLRQGRGRASQRPCGGREHGPRRAFHGDAAAGDGSIGVCRRRRWPATALRAARARQQTIDRHGIVL